VFISLFFISLFLGFKIKTLEPATGIEPLPTGRQA